MGETQPKLEGSKDAKARETKDEEQVDSRAVVHTLLGFKKKIG